MSGKHYTWMQEWIVIVGERRLLHSGCSRASKTRIPDVWSIEPSDHQLSAGKRGDNTSEDHFSSRLDEHVPRSVWHWICGTCQDQTEGRCGTTCWPYQKVQYQPEAKDWAELKQMEDTGIIRKVREHTEWCSSIVYSTKRDGSLRICLDPKRLNESIKRCPHKMPTLEEINPAFVGAKHFSKLDAKAGYWSIQLEDESQLLTTLRTPIGRYCYQRLPFGLCVSQDIFQQRMDEIILESLEGCVGIADNICIFGATQEEHDLRLIALMEVAKSAGLVCSTPQSAQSTKAHYRCLATSTVLPGLGLIQLKWKTSTRCQCHNTETTYSDFSDWWHTWGIHPQSQPVVVNLTRPLKKGCPVWMIWRPPDGIQHTERCHHPTYNLKGFRTYMPKTTSFRHMKLLCEIANCYIIYMSTINPHYTYICVTYSFIYLLHLFIALNNLIISYIYPLYRYV